MVCVFLHVSVSVCAEGREGVALCNPNLVKEKDCDCVRRNKTPLLLWWCAVSLMHQKCVCVLKCVMIFDPGRLLAAA